MNKPGIIRQSWHFFVHLRWHYQVFILSGGFLMGGVYSSEMDFAGFVLQFANVHLLLFGGATAYNSYWDKDEGPIGGLPNPPEMQRWMWPASLMLQLAGLGIALAAGYAFATIYIVSMVFFWLYSTPLARWKATPVKSLIAIGGSTGFNSVLMGYFATGVDLLVPPIGAWICALGVAFMLLSLYPVSQVYQIEEDRNRGDRTFAVVFGPAAVKRFFKSSFIAGAVMVSLALGLVQVWLGLGFVVASGLVGLWVNRQLPDLQSTGDHYRNVMHLKYGMSLGFVLLLIIAIVVRHGL